MIEVLASQRVRWKKKCLHLVFYYRGSQCYYHCSGIFFMRQMQGGKGDKWALEDLANDE